MEQETDVYEFMKKTLELPSFVTPRFFDPSVYKYDRVCLEYSVDHSISYGGVDMIHSVVVKEVIGEMVNKIFSVFDQTHQTGYYVNTQMEMVSKFFTQPNTIIDPSLYTYLMNSQHQFINLNNLGSSGTIRKIGMVKGSNIYVNDHVKYNSNTLKTFDIVEGFIRFDKYTKEYDKRIYEFVMCFSIINPRQYHIFNVENSSDTELRLDLMNNYLLYQKIKEYKNSNSIS